MFEDPSEPPIENAADPAARAREKADHLRLHAEFAAVFEGCRKFEAQLKPGLNADLARDVQRTIAKLEKSRHPDAPLIPPESVPEAERLLRLPDSPAISTNDYHLYRRPGEVMILRLLSGDQVNTFYERLTAHFNAALAGMQEDERTALEWQQDPKAATYLKALDEIKYDLPAFYLREPIKALNLHVLSTQTADEFNINFLADTFMGVPVEELVGQASAPPDEPSESDLAWFFKLFSLRGMIDGVERMCFFVFLQKSDDASW